MKAIDEVIEHHRFIESWLSGRATDLGGFFDMHTPDFTWYDPDGAVLTLADLRGAMEEAHGTVPGLRIRILEPRVLLDRDGLTVATYEEHHPDTTRRAVAMMVPAPEARNGLLWRSLHETWTRPGPL
ncbi:DUF4440 domain-containing protein [Actinomadura sp. KC345]|uniref:nuclear transport factor 2 family protein n=1 Tax=Actinomadura sp. KC345 TaxID=2530371 RepID=UPI00104FCE9B|nr:nuclear transport factor 2 family protein [Actinomadura sp. KC345]TDC55110.1 DUF4440 domain-containing protein [Actinomadura sp. KC345]